MRRLVMINYWLMIVGWSMLLNGHVLIGEAIALLGCVLPLVIRKRKIALFMVPVAVVSYLVMYKLWQLSVLSVHFKGLPFMLFLMCLDMVTIYDRLLSLKNRQVLLFLSATMICAIVFSLTAMLVPETDYNILSRAGLQLMVCFIFLPHLEVMFLAALSKMNVKDLRVQKKEALLP